MLFLFAVNNVWLRFFSNLWTGSSKKNKKRWVGIFGFGFGRLSVLSSEWLVGSWTWGYPFQTYFLPLFEKTFSRFTLWPNRLAHSLAISSLTLSHSHKMAPPPSLLLSNGDGKITTGSITTRFASVYSEVQNNRVDHALRLPSVLKKPFAIVDGPQSSAAGNPGQSTSFASIHTYLPDLFFFVSYSSHSHCVLCMQMRSRSCSRICSANLPPRWSRAIRICCRRIRGWRSASFSLEDRLLVVTMSFVDSSVTLIFDPNSINQCIYMLLFGF